MDIRKRNRLVAAGTVAIVLLLVVLVAIMIYQLVVIVQLKERRDQLKEEIDDINQQIEESEDLLDYYENLDNLFDLAIEQGIIGKKLSALRLRFCVFKAIYENICNRRRFKFRSPDGYGGRKNFI